MYDEGVSNNGFRIHFFYDPLHPPNPSSSLNAIVMAVIFGVPVLASSLCFVIYGLTNALNPSIIFPTLTWFGILRFPLMFLPNVLVGAADFKVAMARISKMLIANELKDEPLHIEGKDYSVVIENGNFEWEAPREDELEGTAKSGGPGAGGGSRGPPSRNKSKKYNKKKDAAATDATVAAPTEEKPKEPGFKMSDINVRIPRGSLTAIVGAVGSGKSSLLHAIIGEMRKTSGDISLDGRVGYAAQQAWIQNATVEKNVTFGLEYDETRYANTIKACCLERDLEVFPDGDQTEIGERGINLSGGQKQRSVGDWISSPLPPPPHPLPTYASPFPSIYPSIESILPDACTLTPTSFSWTIPCLQLMLTLAATCLKTVSPRLSRARPVCL